MTEQEFALILAQGEGYRIGYIEKMGTGIPRMQKLLADAGLEPLRYEFSGFVRAVFQRNNTKTTPQVTPQATPQVSLERREEILAFCTTPRSREEIQDFLGLKDREHFRKKILAPLLAEGIIKPTIPDKPNSPKQKYFANKNREE